MKLSELAAEVSEPTQEQLDYDVVVYDQEEGAAETFNVTDVKWQHDKKRLVIKF